jgi:fibronectin-binding autotransporter adhesin
MSPVLENPPIDHTKKPMKAKFNLFIVAAALQSTVFGAAIYKFDNTDNLVLTSSWTDFSGLFSPPGSIGSSDALYFNEVNMKGDKTLALGGNLAVGGLAVDYVTANTANNVVISAGNTLTLNATTLNGGGQNGSGTAVAASGILLNRALGGTLTINSAIALGASQSWTSGRAGGLGYTVNGGVAIGANNLTLNVTDAAGISTVAGSIGGTGKVTKTGAGTLQLPNASTLTGDFQLGPDAGAANTGVVLAGNASSMGTGTLISRGTQLRSSVPGLTIPNPITVGVGGFRVGGINDFSLTGTLSLDNAQRTIANTGAANVSLGAINLSAGAAAVAIFDIASGSGLTRVNGAITGAGRVSVTAGNVAFNGSNNTGGGLAVSGGRISGTGSFNGAVPVAMSGGSIALAGGATTSSLTFASGITFTNAPTVVFTMAPVAATTYDVFRYDSGTVTGIGNLTTGYRGTIANDAVNKKYTFVLGAQGQSRTWNTTTGVWDSGTTANFVEGDMKFYIGDNVVFGAIAADAGVTLTGTLRPASVVVSNAANTYTFSGGAIGGTSSLVKSGAGALALASKQSYTGGTTVTGGVLDLTGGGGESGTIRGTVGIASGATLRLSTGDATGFGAGTAGDRLDTININGGTLNVNTVALAAGGGNQTLGNATLNLTGGAITGIAGSNIDFFQGASALNSFASAITSTISGVSLSPLRQGNTTFTVADGAAAVDLRIDSVVRDSPYGSEPNGIWTKAGAGVLQLNGVNTFTGGLAIAAGTLDISGAGQLGSGNYAPAIATSGVLRFSTSANQTLAGIISGAGSLVKSGTGNLTLPATHTYTGPTSVTGGKLTVAGALDAASAVTVSGSGVLTGNGSVNGAVTVNPGAAISVGNAAAGEISLGSLTFPTTGTINVAELDKYGGFKTPIFLANNLVANGGAGSITVNLPPVILAAGIYNLVEVDGTINATASQFALGTAPALGNRQSGAIKIDSGFVVYEVSGINPIWTGSGNGQWTTAVQSPKNWKTNVATDFINGDGVTFNDTAPGSTTVTLAGTVVPSSVLFNHSTAKDYSLTGAGAITGAGLLTKSGTGTLTIGTTNNYSGGTIINGGVLDLLTGGTLGSGAVTLAGARLNLTDPIFGNAIVTTDGTLGGSSYQINGVISGNSLNIAASGIVSLNAVNTYTGATTVVSGGLELVGPGQLGAGDYAGAITNPALLRFDTTADQILRGAISGAGQLVKNKASTLTLNGVNIYTGPTIVNGGTLRMGTSTAMGAYQAGRPATQVVVASGGTLEFNGIGGATYGYTIAGSGVGGIGALTNSGNAITNGLAQASNIRLSADASIGGSGNWALLTNGWNATTLDLNGNTLTKTGANTITMVSATTTAGSVRASSGTLVLGATEGGSGVTGAASAFILDDTAGVALSMVKTSSLGSLAGGGAIGGNIALTSGTTLTIGGLATSTSYGGIISGAAALTKTGPGTQVLTGANSYSGATTISGGTLDLSTTGQIYTGAYRNVQLTINGGGTLKIKNFGYNVTPGSAASLGGLRDQGESKLINDGTFEVLGVGHSSGSNFSIGANGGTFRYAPAVTTDTLTLSGNGNSNIAVAGVLTLDAVGKVIIAEIIDGAGSLVKTGGQTLTLTGANAYAGATTVSAGILAVTGNSLPNGTSLTVGAGGVNLTANETVGTLFFGTTQKAAGIWGAPGSGAPNTDARFSGTGTLIVTNGPAVVSGYGTWADVNAPGQGAGGDFDNDGVSNGAEYVLGGLASTQDSGKLPTISASGANLVFSFKRDQDSKTVDTTVAIEVGTTLASWTDSYSVGNDTAGSTTGVTVTDNGDGFDTVTLTIPKGSDTKKFARLSVIVN